MYDWNVINSQAGMKSSDQLWNDSLPSFLKHGWEYATIPGLLHGANELIAHFTLL